MIKYLVIALLAVFPLTIYAQGVPVLRKKSIPSSASRQSSEYKRVDTHSFRIAAIRVEFQTDDNPLTSGDGTFDYSDGSGVSIDPPPHDRQYFLDHLEALKRYYKRVSREKVEITYDVYPEGDRTSYKLPNEIAYYNPETTEEELDLRLSELLKSSIELADDDPAVDFSQYNAVIIFHAGVGSDFALEEAILDPTPHDLPSVYLDLDHLRRTIGNDAPDYKGIPVDGGAVFITRAVILPETESKRGVEIGLNGIAAHQFGHFFGLPSLFNTVAGRPAIGKWGLMGVGFSNLNGTVPPEPSAWSKVFLGWEVPVEVSTGTTVEIVSSMSAVGNRIYKIPVSPAEYFLIENRQQDQAGDGLNVTLGSSGVIIEADDYDTDIPGSGILIWHIDDRVISGGLKENTVNADPERRGVDLEEADGSQDIGEDFPGLIPGFGTPENGLAEDAYYAGNNTEFTPNSVPNSYSSNRGNSHISVTDISESGNKMTFSVSRDWYIAGYPKYLGGDLTGMAPVWTRANSAGEVNLVVASRDGSIFALNGSNNPFVDNGTTAMLTDYYGISSQVSVPLFAKINTSITAVPALRFTGTDNTDLYKKLVIATGKPGIKVFSLEDENNDTFGDLAAEWDLPSKITSPVMVSNWIITGGEDGSLLFYTGTGILVHSASIGASEITGLAGTFPVIRASQTIAITREGSYQSFLATDPQKSGITGNSGPLAPLFTDLDADGKNEFVVISEDGSLFILNDQVTKKIFDEPFSVAPAAGDVNGDGFREIVSASGDRIFVIERNGSVSTGFPLKLSFLGYNEIVTTELVLGDLNGDGSQEILFGTSGGNVFAVGNKGEIVPGFPLPLGSSAVGSLTLMKNATRDNLELAALDINGYLYVWDLETAYADKSIAWGTYGGSSARLRSNVELLNIVPEPPSNRIMEPGRVYNYPNPNSGNWTNIRYYLYRDAKVDVRIYSQIGELVATLSGPGIGLVDNEITWDLTSVESGVYLAQVSASSGGITEQKVIKIAVIK